MKSFRLTVVLISLFTLLSFSITPVFAADPDILLNAPFPTPGGLKTIPSGENAFGTYLVELYKFSWIIGAFLAMLMIVIGAVQYTISAGNSSGQNDAKDRILNAIYGLVLLLAVALILRTLNPNLLTLTNTSTSSGNSGGTSRPTLLRVTDLTFDGSALTWANNDGTATSIKVEYGDGDPSHALTILTTSLRPTETRFTVPPEYIPTDPSKLAIYYVTTLDVPYSYSPPAETTYRPVGYAIANSAMATPSDIRVAVDQTRTLFSGAPIGVIRIRWQDNSTDESYFEVNLSAIPDGSPFAPGPNDIARVNRNRTEVELTNGYHLVSGSTYYARVRAVNQQSGRQRLLTSWVSRQFVY